MSSVFALSKQLKSGRLVILTDDFNEKVSYFVGDLNKIETEHINFMIKKGKGLVYACISENKAKQLELPIMGDGGENQKCFTVSTDHNTVTTGISAVERAETLKALNKDHAKPSEFIRPGHVFPLIYTRYGLLNNRNIAEAAYELVKSHQEDHKANAYICEILNNQGAIATIEEVKHLASTYNMEHITLSDLLGLKYQHSITSFEGILKEIPYVTNAPAFPNMNVTLKHQNPNLERGVYGILVNLSNNFHKGILHVNEKGAHSTDKIYDICLLDPLRFLPKEKIEVEVKFYLRDLRVFASSSIDDLVVRYKKDYEASLRLFRLFEKRLDVLHNGS